MKIESNPRSAKLVVSLLNTYDAAWVKRSDGRWCYAILAEKIFHDADGDSHHGKLRFVVDGDGSAKTMSCHRWGENVRMVRDSLESRAISKQDEDTVSHRQLR